MKKTKIIALYLPQFHKIPENDKWWGEGFTEWTNVKKAKPIFEGHLQPRLPYCDDYYDLSKPGELVKQMNIARNYGIDGFCFYHYWFNGKKLLEKPIEMLLNNKSVPLNFMLCWANEPWTRTWDGELGAKEILMKQDYGKEEDWKEHFYYLLQFFQREEYIKVGDRPVIGIYRPSDIAKSKEMFDLWETLAKENGFKNGLFFIMPYRDNICNYERTLKVDAIYDFEPFSTMQYLHNNEMMDVDYYKTKMKGLLGDEYKVFDYDRFGKVMSERFFISGRMHYPGFFTGWDNSPRIGKRLNICFVNNSPDIIEKYFRIQYQKSINLNSDFIFINAWNEWGEGAILQPDNIFKTGYLEAIKRVVNE